MRNIQAILPLLVVLAASQMASAQGKDNAAFTGKPFRTPPGWAGLLQDDLVQQDLQLSSEQATKIKLLLGKLAAKPNEVKPAVTKLLKAKQLTRSEQLNWQREGGYALLDPKVAQALGLSKKQKSKLADAAKTNAIEHQKIKHFMARARFRSRQAMHDYVTKFRKPAEALLMKVLERAQHAKLKTLLGKNLANAQTATE